MYCSYLTERYSLGNTDAAEVLQLRSHIGVPNFYTRMELKQIKRKDRNISFLTYKHPASPRLHFLCKAANTITRGLQHLCKFTYTILRKAYNRIERKARNIMNILSNERIYQEMYDVKRLPPPLPERPNNAEENTHSHLEVPVYYS